MKEKNGYRRRIDTYEREWDQKTGLLRISGVEDFDPVHIFECGQCFRWEREADGGYTGTAAGRTVSLKKEGTTLILANSTEEDFENFWFDYFDLGRDYGSIKETLSRNDAVMEQAVKFGGGIRLLHQDPWETVVSFLISQNSSIVRIRGCIERLCAGFGEPIGVWRGKMRFSFPGPRRLAALKPEDLAECRLGYRDRYVISAAAALAEDEGRFLSDLRQADYETAFRYVRSLYGVGPKVADCILLFGLMKYEIFPLDVWMKRIMSGLYGFDPRDTKGMSEYAAEHFGTLSGFAQQYLFYYAKENL